MQGFNTLADMQDSMRQAAHADARSRIRSAVEASVDKETVAAAGVAPQRASGVPLRRALLQSLNDSLRAVQQQNRASASSAMIRGAVAGETDVSAAIQGAQARPRSGFLP